MTSHLPSASFNWITTLVSKVVPFALLLLLIGGLSYEYYTLPLPGVEGQVIGEVVSVTGSARILSPGGSRWEETQTGDPVFDKSIIKVGQNSIISVDIQGNIIQLIENSELYLENSDEDGSHYLINLLEGDLFLKETPKKVNKARKVPKVFYKSGNQKIQVTEKAKVIRNKDSPVKIVDRENRALEVKEAEKVAIEAVALPKLQFNLNPGLADMEGFEVNKSFLADFQEYRYAVLGRFKARFVPVSLPEGVCLQARINKRDVFQKQGIRLSEGSLNRFRNTIRFKIWRCQLPDSFEFVAIKNYVLNFNHLCQAQGAPALGLTPGNQKQRGIYPYPRKLRYRVVYPRENCEKFLKVMQESHLKLSLYGTGQQRSVSAAQLRQVLYRFEPLFKTNYGNITALHPELSVISSKKESQSKISVIKNNRAISIHKKLSESRQFKEFLGRNGIRYFKGEVDDP